MSNDKVGYGKPPKKHRFKKGQSGNPRGRPKKIKSDSSNPTEAEILEKLANETVFVDGREMTKRELELRVLEKKALSGNISAMKLQEEKRAKAGVCDDKPKLKGVLRLGPKPTQEEWMERAEKNQAQYRENRQDDGIESKVVED